MQKLVVTRVGLIICLPQLSQNLSQTWPSTTSPDIDCPTLITPIRKPFNEEDKELSLLYFTGLEYYFEFYSESINILV